ncbi:MAG: hypothetical protein J2P29_13855, partial [Actinobacteria bacterium]|nr:hypothetical protein [Actinomycetota bacterium]
KLRFREVRALRRGWGSSQQLLRRQYVASATFVNLPQPYVLHRLVSLIFEMSGEYGYVGAEFGQCLDSLEGQRLLR